MLHEILTARRKALNMSIDELVEKSGVPKGTLTKVLTGVSPNPALETARSICYALGLTLDDLFEDRPRPLSNEALTVAYAYDSASTYGKTMIDAVVDQEKLHVVKRRVPMVITSHDSDVYARYLSKREAEEAENDIIPHNYDD